MRSGMSLLGSWDMLHLSNEPYDHCVSAEYDSLAKALKGKGLCSKHPKAFLSVKTITEIDCSKTDTFLHCTSRMSDLMPNAKNLKHVAAGTE